MKKIIISNDIITAIKGKRSLLERSSIRIFEASSNAEVLDIHSAEKSNLIITNSDMPGMRVEELCSAIRNDQELRNVSIITVCPDCEEGIKRNLQAMANSVITKPVYTEVLIDEAQKLLSIANRASFRVPIAVKVEGKHMDKPFLGHSENISVSGMLFDSDKAIDKNELIVCSFILDDNTRITANAKVVRVEGRQMGYDILQYGIRFIDAAEEYISAIEAFVEEALKETR